MVHSNYEWCWEVLGSFGQTQCKPRQLIILALVHYLPLSTSLLYNITMNADLNDHFKCHSLISYKTAFEMWMLIKGKRKQGAGNGERRTENEERGIGSKWTAVLSLKFQNGGRDI